MKLKLPIIAALATFAIALPVKAEDTRGNKEEILGAYAGLNCNIEKGFFTREVAVQAMQEYIKEYPNLINAYIWVTISPKAQAAVKILAGYVNSDCSNFTISENLLDETIEPYLD